MEQKNLAVPLGVFAVAALGLAIALHSPAMTPEETSPNGNHPATSHVTPATHTSAGHQQADHTAPATPHTVSGTKPAAATTVISLFDGKSLTNWKKSDFGGDGEVTVDKGQIIVRAGQSLSGVTWNGFELPKTNYEIELDAMKLDGSDFFLGLTFPYKDDCASLILGGWGGNLVGISSVDGNDASSNSYATTRNFAKNKWYHVRLRTTPTKIQAWFDDDTDPFLDVDTTDKRISTRGDIDNARPLGLSTYQTSAAYKNITLRKL